jgi:hypothetical protein
MTRQEKPGIPPHTKWGIRGTAVILLLLTAMIIKNCMGSFMYGVSTEQELQKQYYEIGYSHGMQKAQGINCTAKATEMVGTVPNRQKKYKLLLSSPQQTSDLDSSLSRQEGLSSTRR